MRGDDLRGIGAVRESDMVGPATGSIPVAGPTVTVWSGVVRGNQSTASIADLKQAMDAVL